MKRILTLAVAVVAMASCSKEGFQDVDVIHNQGSSQAILNGITMSPGQQEIVPHTPNYSITCSEGCKVNINGSIYYQSGVYQNNSKRKHKF